MDRKELADGLEKLANHSDVFWGYLYSELEREYMRQAAAALRGPEWRPIESAPKDGTDIMLGAGVQTFRGQPVPARVTVGHWTTEEECRICVGDCGGECRCPEYDHSNPWWLSWDGGFTAENAPTHWMPLPPPPEESK